MERYRVRGDRLVCFNPCGNAGAEKNQPALRCGRNGPWRQGFCHPVTAHERRNKVHRDEGSQAQLARLRRYHKALARKKKGSANRRKMCMRLSRLHATIANVGTDYLHKLSTEIVRSFQVLGIEDLNVRGMSQNRRLSRSQSVLSSVTIAGQGEIVTRTRQAILSSWPQALRCQPVERNALARFARAA